MDDTSANASLVAFLVSANSASKAGGAQSFGHGFYGGLYFDGTTIYGIGSDAFAAGALYSIDSQTASTQLFGVGYGYYQAGLTAGPDVPEPATYLLLGSGITFLMFWRKR